MIRRPPRASAALALALALAVPAAGRARAAAPAPAAPAAVRIPEPVVQKLENGLTVAVFPVRRLPILQVQLLVPGGAADQATGEAGLASLTADALRQGTPSRDAVEIAREAEALGATISATAGRDYTLVSGSFLAGDLDHGLELLADLVLRPSFPFDAVDQLRREATGAVLQGLRNPVASADDELWRMALPAHPYGAPLGGTLESVTSLGVPQLRAFYRDHYRPDRCVLAIAGDVEPQKAAAAAAEWFGPWAGHAAAERSRPAPPAPALRVRIVDRPEMTRCEIRVGAIGPARNSPDDLPFALANWVLGGSSASRLARAAPGARSTFTPLREAGLLALATSSSADSAGTEARALLGALERLGKAPPDEAELARARRTFGAVYPLPFETLAGITAQWLAGGFYGLPEDFSTRFAERLAQVTPAAVAAAARRWADPSHAVVVVLGPAARLRPQLEALGPVEVLPPGGTIAGAPPPTAEEQARGRDLIARALEAHGGRAKLEGIRRSSLTADVVLGVGADAVEAEMTQVRAEPARFALVTKVHGEQRRQVLDAGHTWTETASDSVTPPDQDSTAVASMKAAYESDLPHLLLAAVRPEARVAWRGQERVGDHDADRVEVALPGAPPRRYLLDARTHRLLGLDEPGRAGFGYGAHRTFDDYRLVDGVWWPHHEERAVDGQRVMMLDIRSVALNAEIPEALFQRPNPIPGMR